VGHRKNKLVGEVGGPTTEKGGGTLNLSREGIAFGMEESRI